MSVPSLQVTDLYDPREQWASYLINALKAKELQARDVNYIVRGQEVIIVDEFTGRTMPGRRWGDGLHQARPPVLWSSGAPAVALAGSCTSLPRLCCSEGKARVG